VSFNTSYCASIFVPSWVNSGDDSLFLWWYVYRFQKRNLIGVINHSVYFGRQNHTCLDIKFLMFWHHHWQPTLHQSFRQNGCSSPPSEKTVGSSTFLYQFVLVGYSILIQLFY
jgi:hypothetical protein